MKENYVNMHANYFYMRDDYVDMQVTNRFKESYFIWLKWLTNAGLWHHRGKVQHYYMTDNMTTSLCEIAIYLCEHASLPC